MNEQILTGRPLPGARLNMAHPLTKGLFGCWLMNETGGMRAMDLSPYGINGTLTGFGNPPRRSFNGLLFNGSSDYINVVTPKLSALDEMSAISWFNWNGGGGGADGRKFIFETTPDPGSLTHQTLVATTNTFRGGLRQTDTTFTTTDSVTPVTVNTWHQGVFTFKRGAFLSVYLDGRFESQAAVTDFATDTSTGLNIGSFRLANDRWFSGLLACVALYRRCLTAEDVRYLHLHPYAMFEDQ